MMMPDNFQFLFIHHLFDSKPGSYLRSSPTIDPIPDDLPHFWSQVTDIATGNLLRNREKCTMARQPLVTISK